MEGGEVTVKRALIGGFLSLLGTIWGVVVLLYVADNWVSNWYTPPGRFLTTVWETGMTAPFVLAMALLLAGLVILGIEYFKKDQ